MNLNAALRFFYLVHFGLKPHVYYDKPDYELELFVYLAPPPHRRRKRRTGYEATYESTSS